MKITGGAAKGRRILTKPGLSIRPTPARVRKAIFDIIGGIGGARVLDLYAGCGTLGMEALSRGAARAVFVDSSAESVKIIKRNLETLGFEDRAKVMRSGAIRAIKNVAESAEKFDIIFLDPPYFSGEADKALKALAELPVGAEEAFVVLEHTSKIEPRLPEEKLELLTKRRYGDTAITICKIKSERSTGGQNSGLSRVI